MIVKIRVDLDNSVAMATDNSLYHNSQFEFLLAFDSKKILLKVVSGKLHKENMRCISHSNIHVKQKMGA